MRKRIIIGGVAIIGLALGLAACAGSAEAARPAMPATQVEVVRTKTSVPDTYDSFYIVKIEGNLCLVVRDGDREGGETPIPCPTR